jgi:hypothetical protein
MAWKRISARHRDPTGAAGPSSGTIRCRALTIRLAPAIIDVRWPRARARYEQHRSQCGKIEEPLVDKEFADLLRRPHLLFGLPQSSSNATRAEQL